MNIPVLGICAGMQVLGVIYDVPLTECKLIGQNYIDVLKDDDVLGIKKGKLKVYDLHKYSVKENKGIEIIAKSGDCVEIAKFSNYHYGVAFHPEVMNENIIKNFIKTIF